MLSCGNQFWIFSISISFSPKILSVTRSKLTWKCDAVFMRNSNQMINYLGKRWEKYCRIVGTYLRKKSQATSRVYASPAWVTSVLTALITDVCSSSVKRWDIEEDTRNSLTWTRKFSSVRSDSGSSNIKCSPCHVKRQIYWKRFSRNVFGHNVISPSNQAEPQSTRILCYRGKRIKRMDCATKLYVCLANKHVYLCCMDNRRISRLLDSKCDVYVVIQEIVQS